MLAEWRSRLMAAAPHGIQPVRERLLRRLIRFLRSLTQLTRIQPVSLSGLMSHQQLPERHHYRELSKTTSAKDGFGKPTRIILIITPIDQLRVQLIVPMVFGILL